MSDKNVANRLTGSALVKKSSADREVYTKAMDGRLGAGDLADVMKKVPRNYELLVSGSSYYATEAFVVDIDHAAKKVYIG